MKLNNYPTYSKKDWKSSKGRFIDKTKNSVILPIDEIDVNLLLLQIKVKKFVESEFLHIKKIDVIKNAVLK